MLIVLYVVFVFFFFKQKTAYEMRISDWSSDVCSSDLFRVPLIIRGEIIDDGEIDHGGRRGGVSFQAPDISKHVAKLPLRTPSLMADLYTLSFEDILDYQIGRASCRARVCQYV